MKTTANKMDDYNITEEQKKEIDDIFNDTEFLDCMDRGLANRGTDTDVELARQRRKEAIEAFSANPPEFWAMIGK